MASADVLNPVTQPKRPDGTEASQDASQIPTHNPSVSEFSTTKGIFNLGDKSGIGADAFKKDQIPFDNQGNTLPDAPDGEDADPEDDDDSKDDSPALPENYDDPLAGKPIVDMQVFKDWAPVIPWIRFWWNTEITAQQKQTIEQMNRVLLKKYTGTSGPIEFPLDTIYANMKSIAGSLEILGKMENFRHGRLDMKVLQSTVAGMYTMRLNMAPYRLDWSLFLNEANKRKVLEVCHQVFVLDCSKTSQFHAQALKKSILDPNERQHEVLNLERTKKIQTVITKYVRNEISLDHVIQEFEDFNKDIKKINKEMGLKPLDHTIPIKVSKSILEKANDADGKTEAMGEMKARLNITGLDGLIPDSIKTGTLTQSKQTELLEKALKNFDPDVSCKDAETGTQKALAGLGESSSEPPSAPSVPQPQLGGITSSGDSLFVEEYDASEITFPEVHGLRTTFGKVSFVRPAGLGRYRLFVNAGTEQKPFARVINGSDLGRGVAEQMVKENPAIMVKPRERDYARRRRPTDIEKVHDICTIPTKRGSYGWVEMTWKKCDREGTENLPVGRTNETWSDFAAIVGKKQADVYRKQLEQKATRNLKFFERMKREGKHPDDVGDGTEKRALTDTDRQESPWLCATDVSKVSRASSPAKEEDHEILIDEAYE